MRGSWPWMAALVAGVSALAPAARAQGAAEAYCVSQGGVVETRVPVYNTNGPLGDRLKLAGSQLFCTFTADDGSRISTLLFTLVTSQPTLAALAYYGQQPFDGSKCVGSPGSCYCSQLGGTDLFGGVNAAGGGWVSTANRQDVLDACIFPDQSSIDSYGLFYHSAGIIRGKDLNGVLRYPDPDAVKR
jgi:putative hemolysin